MLWMQRLCLKLQPTMDSSYKLKLISHNSTGWNELKGNYLIDLANLLEANFISVQEHFHLRPNVYKIENSMPGFNSFIVPATKQTNVVSSGRPTGGLALFWRKSIQNLVKVKLHPTSSRVHAVEFMSNYLIINCYFPVDPKTANFDDFNLLSCLQDIQWYIDSHPNHTVVLAGDFNADLSRNTRFVNIIRDFMMNNSLVTAWSSFPVDYTFCHNQVRNGTNIVSTSTIDHFMVNSDKLGLIEEALVLHTGDNLSVHEPIFMSLNVESYQKPTAPTTEKVINTPKPMWSKASDDMVSNYRCTLSSNLKTVKLTDGVTCSNPKCKNKDHLSDITVFCEALMKSMDSAVKSEIPTSNKKPNEKVVPGWSQYVKSYQDDAKFWYSIWVSCGKPTNCEVHNVMKHTRNVYHLAVRRAKRNAVEISKDKMLQSCLNGGSSNLIGDLKKQRLSKVRAAPTIDGKTDNIDIANHFSSIYSDLYNRSDSSSEMNNLLQDIEKDIDYSNFSDIDKVTPAIVYQAISSINSNKSDSIYDFKSDAILFGKDILTNHITVLLQSFVIHGFVPNMLLSCSLKPIIKDNLGDKSDSSNYRAIGISSLILKILDLVILILFGNELKPSDLQFGFQKKNSTTMCTWVVSESINYFNNRDTPVYVCFLDISKAFDLVNFSKLFKKLQ